MTKKEAITIAIEAQKEGWVFTGYRRNGQNWGVDLTDPKTGYAVHFWDAENYNVRDKQRKAEHLEELLFDAVAEIEAKKALLTV